MVLDARLEKIANDPKAGIAATAFARSLSAAEELTEGDRANAAEFEAVIEAMFIMALVDGEIKSDELLQLSGSVEAILRLHGESGDAAEMALPLLRLNDILKTLGGRYGAEGQQKRFRAIAERLRSPRARVFCYRLAAAVAFVDDYVHAGEVDALDELATVLGLSKEESQAVLREVHETLAER